MTSPLAAPTAPLTAASAPPLRYAAAAPKAAWAKILAASFAAVGS
ncbi:hypothetical protein [Stenoxybacter acetivorans]|nr:hypothetical protein [Stenoxybacter acetivorans]